MPSLAHAIPRCPGRADNPVRTVLRPCPAQLDRQPCNEPILLAPIPSTTHPVARRRAGPILAWPNRKTPRTGTSSILAATTHHRCPEHAPPVRVDMPSPAPALRSSSGDDPRLACAQRPLSSDDSWLPLSSTRRIESARQPYPSHTASFHTGPRRHATTPRSIPSLLQPTRHISSSPPRSADTPRQPLRLASHTSGHAFPVLPAPSQASPDRHTTALQCAPTPATCLPRAWPAPINSGDNPTHVDPVLVSSLPSTRDTPPLPTALPLRASTTPRFTTRPNSASQLDYSSRFLPLSRPVLPSRADKPRQSYARPGPPCRSTHHPWPPRSLPRPRSPVQPDKPGHF